MSHTRRSVFGRSRLQQKRGRASARSRRGLINFERLEDRVLLAADINPWHNAYFPTDVNGDYRVGPLDALLVINALNDGGSRRLGDLLASNLEGDAGAAGEGEAAKAAHMVDVNGDRYLSPIDALGVINQLNEGEDPVKLVKAEAQLTQNIPADGVTPINRPVVTTVNPGETILLNIFVEDVRTDDGVFQDKNSDGVDDSDEYGIFAAYFDVNYDPQAFQVPNGTGINPNGSFNFPISYVNPKHRQSFGSVIQNNFLETQTFNFPNGPFGVLDRNAGLIDEAGGFSPLLKPVGKELPQVPPGSRDVFLELHVFDVPFTAQSLYAAPDTTTVSEGSSVQFNVLANDGLVQGDYAFTLSGADAVGREILTFGNNGTATGTTGKGSVVPEANVLFVNGAINVPLGGRQLSYVGVIQQPTKGLVTGTGGQLTYTPNAGVSGPTTDVFTYQISDGQGRTRTASVTVTIEPLNDPPLINAPAAVAVDEDAVLAFQNANSVSITEADGDAMNVSLAAGSAIAVAAGSGATFTDADGSDGTLAFSGTQTQINAALAGLTYTPDAQFYGSSQLVITAQDKLTDETVLHTVNRTVTITVQPINDPPTLAGVPADQTVENSNLPLTITTITVGDAIDAQYAQGGDVNGRLTLEASGGTFSVTPLAGLTIGGNGTSNLTVTGLTAGINSLVASGVDFTGPVGTHSVTVTMNDLGNVDKNGVAAALEVNDSFNITVVPPTRPFAANDQFTAEEDGGASEYTVLLNDFNFNNQLGGANLNITGVSDPGNGTASVTGGGTTVTYTPDPDFFGQDTFTYTIVDTSNAGDGPSTATVTVIVSAVNDQPSFTASDPAAVNEDAGPQTLGGWAAFDAGNAFETAAGQGVLAYQISGISDPGLFAPGGAPSVSTNGTLTYTPAADAWGTSTFTVAVQDNGGTGNGGIDTSAAQTFTITVESVNDRPTFTASDPPAVNEGAGSQTIPGWASNFDPGPADESGQNLVGYTVTSVSNPGLFATLPAIGMNGTLTYTLLNDDVFGSSTFQVTVQDDGGTARGGLDTSLPQTFTLTVNPVNDAPSFTAANPAPVEEDSGPQTVAGWASFDPGPDNESGQNVAAYLVSGIGNPSLFATPPSVSTNGTLTYTPAANAHGSSTFSVAVRDNGGTANGGVDTSPTTEFTVTVTAKNDPPVNRINGSDSFAANPQTTDDNTPLPFNAANGNLIQVGDVDDPQGNVATYTVQLSVDEGQLDLGGARAAVQTLTGSLSQINADLANLVYHPPTDYIGPANLTVESNDGGTFGAGPVGTDSDTVTIDVAPFNDPPIARTDLIDTPEGSPVAFDPLADNGNGADSAGPNEDGFQEITVVQVDAAGTSGGTVSYSAATGLVTYTPPSADFFGTDTFTYTIRDNGQSRIDGVIQPDPKEATGSVTVTVLARNDNPNAQDDLLLTDPQPQVGQQFTFPVSDLLGNDNAGPANESGQVLRVLSVISPTAKGATVEVLDQGTQDPSDDVIRYTVPANFDHVDTFTYTVQDNGISQQRVNGLVTDVADPKTDTAAVTVRDVVMSDISGYVYFDRDGDARRDGDEHGLGGVRIDLAGTDVTGAAISKHTWTDATGWYEFADLLPSQEGTQYTISQTQPMAFLDGLDTGGNGNATVFENDRIRVFLPLIGFDTENPENSATRGNNFGESGLTAFYASLGLRDLLHSDLDGNNSLLQSGWLFATDASGQLQWFIDIGGWHHYVPGEEDANNPGRYHVDILNGTLWVTDLHEGAERQLYVPMESARLRQVNHGGQTVTHIIGDADDFGLPSYGMAAVMQGALMQGEGMVAESELQMLAAAGAGDAYSQAVDAIFAAGGEVA